MKLIKIKNYNQIWPKIFNSEALAIQQILADNYFDIHHIGSTAVYGLIAKPIIDILVIVQDLGSAIKLMQLSGYEYRGEYNIPMRAYFNKTNQLPLNIHMYMVGHAEINLNLLFRNHLRTNRAAKFEYAKLKVKLIESTAATVKINDFSNYTLGKNSFICKILHQAGFSEYRITKVAHNSDLVALANLSKQKIILKIADITSSSDMRYILLHRGIVVIGYCCLEFTSSLQAVVIDFVANSINSEIKQYFLKLIKQWLEFNNYKLVV